MPNDESGIRLQALLLADYATIRDSLLTVVSAGVTRVGCAEFPRTPSLYIALQFYIPPTALGIMHSGRLSVRYADGDLELIGKAELALQVHPDPNGFPGEAIYLPYAVGWPMNLTRPGAVDINVDINGAAAGSLTFWVVHSADLG